MIDKETIQRVMDATDIVEVVKDFVTLRKAGANYKGLCPFHNERTPSFSVSPSRQLCKCFSCGKGGNAVHFLMELEHMTYPEAIKWLAKKYGIEIREAELTDEERVAQSDRESMFALNEWTSKYFQNVLHNDVDGVAIGMAYFRSRGFRDDIIRKFSLGYSPVTADALATSAIAHGFNKNFLIKNGLCFETENGKLIDRFHGRVIFPVFTVSGRVVAFGGRILNTEKVKGLAKYVNSPESDIYNKSKELYGLYQSKDAIRRSNCCFLVEGYTDVISMHQSGIENVVASSGTSLTEGQIRLLHRFTENIIISYDCDSAGIRANLRGINMLLAEGMNIKVLLLPDGEDPDSFSKKNNAETVKAYVATHQVDFIKFMIKALLDEAADDPLKRASLINDIVKTLSVIPNNIVRQMYVHECASTLAVSEELIIKEINKLHRQNQKAEDKKATNEETVEQTATSPVDNQLSLSKNKEYLEERFLISIVIRYGNHLMSKADGTSEETVVEYICEDLENEGIRLRNDLYQEVLNDSLKHVGEADWSPLSYFTAHPNPLISRLAVDVGQDNYILSTQQREQYIEDQERLNDLVPHILFDIKHSIIKEKIQDLLLQLRNPQMQDSSEVGILMQQYMELCKIERQLAKLLGDRVISKSKS